MSAASTENIQKCLDTLDEINSEASIVFNKETYNALVEAEKELAALVAIANTSTNTGMAGAEPPKICPSCDGSGHGGYDMKNGHYITCNSCLGTGKLRHA
jgi:DnaJ-class molecular chaperone